MKYEEWLKAVEQEYIKKGYSEAYSNAKALGKKNAYKDERNYADPKSIAHI